MADKYSLPPNVEPGQFEVPDGGLAAIRGQNLVKRVNAAMTFGSPDPATHKDIMDELVDLVSWRGWSRNEVPEVRWHPNDLDRCQHGRHSIDSCYDCPGGKSSGNLFLDPTGGIRETRMDRGQIRIGTMVRGEPIWVTYRGEPRD